MPSPEAISDAVRAYIAAVNANDKEAFLARFAPDAVWHDPVGAPPHVGLEGIGAFWDQTRSMAEHFEMIIDDLVVCGDEAAVRLRIQVRFDGGSMEMDVIEIFTAGADGRFTLVKAYWDMSRARRS